MFDKKIKQKKEKTKTKTNTKKCLSNWGTPPPPESSSSNSDGVPMGDQLTSQSMNALNAKGGPNKSIAFRNSDIFPTFSV